MSKVKSCKYLFSLKFLLFLLYFLLKIAISVALCYNNSAVRGVELIQVELLGCDLFNRLYFQPFNESMYPEPEINCLIDFSINCKMHK